MNPMVLPPFVIAGHLALDFVNSVATPDLSTIDWLADGDAAIRWFGAVSVFPEAPLRKLQRSVSPAVLDEAAAEARDFREWLRGKLPHAERLTGSLQFNEKLNAILTRGSAFHVLGKHDRQIKLQECERLETPEQLLVPIAKAIGRLITEQDLTRVRACEGVGCSLWFLDQTKSGRRRFCSPDVCGNRAKVAAFRSRQRDSDV